MKGRKKYLFKLYYIGLEKYYGSQRQPNFLTIEDVLIDVLKKREYIENVDLNEFEVSSRTDRYVSARGSTFSCIIEKEPVLMELNSFLPKEIGIWAYSKVNREFSSRHNAKMRHYRYIFKEPLSYMKKNYNFTLDIIRKGCKQFEGIHNFQNFSKRSEEPKLLTRTIKRAEFKIINDYLIFDFESQGFLRQQIRRMVKKLLELGKGELDYGEFLDLFNPETFHSYQPANADGLILWDIKYDQNIKFKIDKKSKKRMGDYFIKQKFEHGLKYQLFNTLEHNNFS